MKDTNLYASQHLLLKRLGEIQIHSCKNKVDKDFLKRYIFSDDIVLIQRTFGTSADASNISSFYAYNSSAQLTNSGTHIRINERLSCFKQIVCCLVRKSLMYLVTVSVGCYSFHWPKFLRHFRLPWVAMAVSWNEQFKKHQKQSNNESHTQTAVIFLGFTFTGMVLKRSYCNDKIRHRDK